MTDRERVLFEQVAGTKVPFILLRLITSTSFGHPYDSHLRQLLGVDNTPVQGTAGQWVLYLGAWRADEYGWVCGPGDGWVGILEQALELIKAAEVAPVELTPEALGVTPPPPPKVYTPPPQRIKWRSL